MTDQDENEGLDPRLVAMWQDLQRAQSRLLDLCPTLDPKRHTLAVGLVGVDMHAIAKAADEVREAWRVVAMASFQDFVKSMRERS